MRQLIKFFFIAVHGIFWIFFLRHVHFFGSQASFPDFDAYRVLWGAVIHGVNPYTVTSMRTLGPPLVIIADAPFFLFPIGVSQVLFFLTNILSGYAACWILCRQRTTLFLLVSLIFWLTFPARFSVLMGQPGPLLAVMVTMALTSPRLRALALAVLTTSKTNFVITLVALIRRQRRIFLQILVILAGVGLTASIVLRPEWYVYYVTHSFVGTLSGHGAGLDYYNQSLQSTFARIGLLALYPALYAGVAVVLMLVLFLSGSVELGVVVSLLLSPIVWQHYMVILFPICYHMVIRERGWKRWWVVVCFILINLDIGVFHTMQPSLLVGIAASHVCIGLCVLTFILILSMIERSHAKTASITPPAEEKNLG